MRYLKFTLKIKQEDIKSEKVRLKDYCYDNNVDALGIYLFQNLKNGVTFVPYRFDNEGMHCMYAIDESIREPEEALNEILGIIEDILVVTIMTVKPSEITMIEFDSNLTEAKRRGYVHNWGRIADQANVILYEEPGHLLSGKCGFNFSELVAGEFGCDEDHLFDKSLRNELKRIRSSKDSATTELKAIPAHYAISARSKEAGSDITLTLMSALAKAGRLQSGRMELFWNIDCDLYKHNYYFERIIDNSYGGTIVIDMTGKFGIDPTEYRLTCEYLCKLIKDHRNSNLFVFLYDMDNPGFTYKLITLLENYMYLIKIREGKGNRSAAEKYLKLLIMRSQFAAYANQAGDYLNTIPQSEYTQTDVINANDVFAPWCMRRNVLKSYNLEPDEGFFLDRDTDNLSAYEKLQSMIGLTAVKEQIDRIILSNKTDRQRKKYGGKGRSMHMVFEGNPGVAKTEVAKTFAKIAKEYGILKSGIFVERAGLDLDGMFAVSAIRIAFEQAKGGVLFIDEAYSMQSQTAVTALIREMEEHRNEVIVVLAGYEERMNKFLELNEGLKSRIPYTVHFPDYTPDELLQIYDYILKQDGYTATPGAREAAREIFEKAVKIKNFGNGRYARNLAEKSTLNMSVRLARKYADKDIPASCLFRVIKEDVFIPNDPIVNGNDGENKPKNAASGKTAREQLESLIGLEPAKKVIQGAIATFKMQRLLRKRGIDIGNNNMHMVFMGNPGAAKTMVARLVAQILKEEGVLPSGVFIEAGRADLVGTYVGSTAPKVRKKFDEANGGVLFIDEAYSLNDGYDQGSFGDEAINTIVQEMDNRREDTIVIFAGYPDEMKAFIERNPGMSSRIAYRVNFDDYSVEELIAITQYMVAEKHLHITDEALAALVPIYETARLNKTFGNGRYVRNAFELALSNLAMRLDKMDEADLTDEVLTTIEACDIAAPALDGETDKPKRKIGFVA